MNVEDYNSGCRRNLVAILEKSSTLFRTFLLLLTVADNKQLRFSLRRN